MDQSQLAAGITFNSQKKNQVLYVICGLLSLAMLAGMLCLPFSDEMDRQARMVLVLGPFAALVMGALPLRALINMRKRWRLDDSGITNLGNSKRVAWEQIADLEMVHPLGGLDELRVEFYDARRNKILSIPTEHLEDYGRSLINALQLRLAPLFERKAQQYLKGEFNWGMTGIKQVLRIDNGLLYVEFPKLKKQIIPLKTIQLVEWLPGPLSGAGKPGFVRIVHDGGSVEVQQRVRGMQFFLYALKHMANLGERVNPTLPPAADQAITTTRRSQSSIHIYRLTGLMLIGWPLFYFFKDLPQFLDQRTARVTGAEVQARIVDRSPSHKLTLEYSAAGAPQRVTVQVRSDMAGQIADREQLTIRVHPMRPKIVWFPVITGFEDSRFLIFTGITGLMVLIGSILLWVGQRKLKRSEALLQGLEQAGYGALTAPPRMPPPPPAMQPAHSLLQGAADEDSLAPDTSDAEPASLPSRTCSHCRQPIAHAYYLAGDAEWCPACKDQAAAVKTKLSWSQFFRAALFGALGALVAGGLWALTIIITEYELGLIAILVGLIVGFAVRYGAGRQGSRAGQVIAVVLTLYALAFAMLPVVYHQIRKDPAMSRQISEAFQTSLERQNEGGLTQAQLDTIRHSADLRMQADDLQVSGSLLLDQFNFDTVTSGTTVSALMATLIAPDLEDMGYRLVPTATSGTLLVQDGEMLTSSTLLAAAAESAEAEPAAPDTLIAPSALESFRDSHPILMLLCALALLLLVLVLGPVVVYLMALFSSPISLIFLAIALWEAWKINRVTAPVFTGPFQDQPALSFEKADYSSR